MSKKKGPGLLDMIDRERHRVATAITNAPVDEWTQPKPNRSVARMFVTMIAVHVVVITGLVMYDFAVGGKTSAPKRSTPSAAVIGGDKLGGQTPPTAPQPSVSAVDPRNDTPSAPPELPALPPRPVTPSTTAPLPLAASLDLPSTLSAPATRPSPDVPTLNPGQAARVELPQSRGSTSSSSNSSGNLAMVTSSSPSSLTQPAIAPALSTSAPASPVKSYTPPPVGETKPAKIEPKATTKTVAKAPEPAPKKVTPKPTPSSNSGTKHTVRRGDNLTAIASRYRVSIDSIVKANRLKNKDQVILGQKLVIPAR